MPGPEFFTDPDNASAFTVNVDLFGVGPAVLTRIRQCFAHFDRAPLTLTTAVFAALGLTDSQLADLLENLRFNGYLDRGNTYVDKAALLGLSPGRFDLALEFYPYRRAVLDAVQQQIADFRSACATVQAEDFRDMAEAAVTARVVERLTGPYLGEGGRLAEDATAFFRDPGNAGSPGNPGSAFTLGEGFLPNEQAAVFQQMAAITAEWQPYALDPKVLADLHFDAAESAALISMLSAAGDLNQYLTIPRERIAYFMRVGSTLAFTLPGIEDYERDIFSALHAVAKELSAAMTELVAALTTLAGQQQAALGAAVADAFGLGADTALALCEAIAGGATGAPDMLVAPALAGTAPAEDTGLGAAPYPSPAVPAEDRFRRACRRIAQFALLAAKLGLSGEETSVVFRDQDLAGKFPEPLALQAGLDRFDTLLDSADGTIYLFRGGNYWMYAAATRALAQEAPKPVHTLSDRLAGLSRIDAAFTDVTGTEWLIGRDAATGPARSQVFVRAPGSHHWVRRDHVWGRVRNNITDPVRRPAPGSARIDTAFRDRDGKTYLFSGDQYVRYSGADYSYVDEGYPRAIAASWEGQQGDGSPARLPAGFRAGLDASFQGLDDRTYLFADDRYACVEDGAADRPVADRWGRVRNVFAGATGIDAACMLGTDLYLFCGDQVIRYADSIENDGLCAREGYPLRIGSAFPGVPAGFERDLAAALVDGDGVINLFKDGKTVALAPGDGVVRPTGERWGILPPALPAGLVDAAFVGLDGKTYLFSGDTYLRYSGSDYTHVDLGYPRAVAGYWGGMRRVTAAFVLDGKTYLFGTAGELFTLTLDYQADLAAGRVSERLRQRFLAYGLPVAEDAPIDGGPGPQWHLTTETQLRITVRREAIAVAGPGDPADPVEYYLTVHNDPANTAKFYVRYSTRTYDQPDAGHPRPLTDTWWNLPADLAHVAADFADVDAVFCGQDGLTYLFAGNQFITFDNLCRWWSRPQSLSDGWESLPFSRVDAAFAGTDGKTYVFSGEQYVRYSGADYTAVDDRYPASIAGRWGEVVNNIARTGRVDATLVVQVPQTEGGEAARTYTYLFSGDQYLRYQDHDYTTVQAGYPKSTATSLADEPGFGNLRAAPADGIDAAFADRRNIYLFSGPRWHVISAAPYRRYGDLGLTRTGCAFVEDGAVLVEEADGWHRYSALEGIAVDRAPTVPHTLRGVPTDFQAGLDAVLAGTDGYTYLFKDQRCFNVELDREYPLAEEWGRPRNNIYDHDTVDAAFVGLDGRTYLFSGDQFVTYAGTSYLDAEIDGDPLPIAEHWAGLTSVALAYLRDGKTYLFEQADADGTMRYLVYSGSDYSQPDVGFPQRTDAGFWGIPDDRRDGFAQVDAVPATLSATSLTVQAGRRRPPG